MLKRKQHRVHQAIMKQTYGKDVAREELEEFAQIHIILLRINGLLPIRRGWNRQLARNLLSLNVHLSHFLISTMYVLNLALGNSDAAVICEFVCMISAHCRYLILFWQRNQLNELLRACCELWAQLTLSEKVTVR